MGQLQLSGGRDHSLKAPTRIALSHGELRNQHDHVVPERVPGIGTTDADRAHGAKVQVLEGDVMGLKVLSHGPGDGGQDDIVHCAPKVALHVLHRLKVEAQPVDPPVGTDMRGIERCW